MTTLVVRNEKDCTSLTARALASRAHTQGATGNAIMPLGVMAAMGLNAGHHALALGVLIAGGVLGVGLLIVSSLNWRRANREEVTFRTLPKPG